MTTPADQLRAAAFQLRNPFHLPGLKVGIDPDLAALVAELLDTAAEDLDMCERINSRDPDNDGATRVMPHPLATDALTVARAILPDDSRSTT